jgi:two-component system osmolarity sensor histidine kinase EnvZ
MWNRSLKHYMPRSLYTRVALILVLPVIAIQLVVSVTFIRRDLEDVTTQMTLTIVRELELIAQQARSAPDRATALERMAPFLETLQMRLRFVDAQAVPARHQIRWYDYSARVVRDTLQAAVPQTLAIRFPDNQEVLLYLDTPLGPAEVSIGRRRVTAAAPHQLIVTAVTTGLLMTVIAYLYMRNQMRPIMRLAEAAQAFGRGRTLPYSPSGAIEVRAAGNAFLDMRARIERHIEQRTLMLSGVSHDLRTPLTRLRLGLAMLEEDEAEPLLRDVDDMQRLLDTFLDFARGAAEGEPETVDPIALVEQIVADAQRAGKPVSLGRVEGEGEMALRPLAIRRAVENLISNGVRHGSRAQVSVVLTDRSLRIRIEDDGPGIPAEARAEAVKPFTRLDPARDPNHGGGVGLGLAIVTDIARAHGGALRLGDSDAMGGLQADIVIGR